MAMSVRYEDDISFSLFDPSFAFGSMNLAIQRACQSQKTAKNAVGASGLGDFANQELVGFAKRRSGTFASPGASNRRTCFEGVSPMLGKLAGAWLGEKVAGRNSGAKGAILGYGAAAVAKRSVPALAALAIGGWAFKKWRDKRRAHASYPPDATPSS
jgi:hypothetical protein